MLSGKQALILAAGFFLAVVLLKPEIKRPRAVSSVPASAVGDAYSENVEARVNHHLSRTAAQMELQRQQSEIQEKEKQLLTDGLSIEPSSNSDATTSSQLDASTHSWSEAQRLNQSVRGSPDSFVAPSIREEVFQQLAEEKEARERQVAYLDEFKKQYIENAKRLGYHVEINDRYEVTKVKPIRQPQSESSDFPSELKRFSVRQFLRAPYCPVRF